MAYKDLNVELLDTVNLNPLPDNLELYTAPIGQGQVVFAVRGISGGIAACNVAYLIKRTIGSGAMCLPFYVDENKIMYGLRDAVSEFSSKAKEVNLNGGDLGLPERNANRS